MKERGGGENEKMVGIVEQRCPSCGLKILFVPERSQLAHAPPECQEFIQILRMVGATIMNGEEQVLENEEEWIRVMNRAVERERGGAN